MYENCKFSSGMINRFRYSDINHFQEVAAAFWHMNLNSVSNYLKGWYKIILKVRFHKIVVFLGRGDS